MQIYAEPGGEKYVGYAKQRLRLMHQQMKQWGIRLLNRRVDVGSGVAIYFKSLDCGNGFYADRVRITRTGGFVYSTNLNTADTIFVINNDGSVAASYASGNVGVYLLAVNSTTIATNAGDTLSLTGSIATVNALPTVDMVTDDINNNGFIYFLDANTLQRVTNNGTTNGTYVLTIPIDTFTMQSWAFRVQNSFYCGYAVAGIQSLVGYDLVSGNLLSTLDTSSYGNSYVACSNATNLYVVSIFDGVTPGVVDEFLLDGTPTGRTLVLTPPPSGAYSQITTTCDADTLIVAYDDAAPTGFTVLIIDILTFSVTNVSANFTECPQFYPACNVNKA